MNALKETLGDKAWLEANQTAIKSALPAEWTNFHELNGLKIGFGLKLAGINWSSTEEFGKVMIFLEKVGILQRRNGLQVRANPLTLYFQ